jgi:hypothetical protein
VSNKPQFIEIIREKKAFTDEAQAILKQAIQEHTEIFLLQEESGASAK